MHPRGMSVMDLLGQLSRRASSRAGGLVGGRKRCPLIWFYRLWDFWNWTAPETGSEGCISAMEPWASRPGLVCCGNLSERMGLARGTVHPGGLDSLVDGDTADTCDVAMPRIRSGHRKSPVYWWNEEIAELRTCCIRHRRRATRIRDHAPIDAPRGCWIEK